MWLFSGNKIIYLAHQVSIDGVHLSNLKLEAIAECTLAQTYLEVCTLLSLVGPLQRLIKGLTCIMQPLTKYLTGVGASKKSEWVSLTQDTVKSFQALKQACMTAPILVFADCTKSFLLETDAFKDGLGTMLSQKQTDGQYHPTPHKKNYHSMKLKFLELKWAVTEHFREYLPYQAFVVQTDNNLLMYIMSTPNLDTTGHQWVGALAWFNFKLEWQKRCDNMVADILSHVTPWMDPETVKSILDRVTLGMAHWAKVHNPGVVEGNQCLEQEVWVGAGHPLVEMHVTDWAKAQREDLMLSTVLDWLKAQRQTNLRMLLVEHSSSEECKLILWNWQNFRIHQGTLYLCSMHKGKMEDVMLSHGSQCTLFCNLEWVPLRCSSSRVQPYTVLVAGMHLVARDDQWGVEIHKDCMHSLQHEGNLCKVPLYPIVSTTPIDLLHTDFTSIEMTMEPNRPPKIANILVFQDHFTKHVMVHMTSNQTIKTATKFLFQGYISIFGALDRFLSDRGANFISNIISKMCKLLGMKKLQTIPYHPQMNGLVERSHQTIMQMIGKLGEDEEADWPGHLAKIVMPIMPPNLLWLGTVHIIWCLGAG